MPVAACCLRPTPIFKLPPDVTLESVNWSGRDVRPDCDGRTCTIGNQAKGASCWVVVRQTQVGKPKKIDCGYVMKEEVLWIEASPTGMVCRHEYER